MSGSEIRECPGFPCSPDDDQRYGKSADGKLTGKKMRVHAIGKAHSVCCNCSSKKELKRP